MRIHDAHPHTLAPNAKLLQAHLARDLAASLDQVGSDVLSEVYTYVHTYMYHTYSYT